LKYLIIVLSIVLSCNGSLYAQCDIQKLAPEPKIKSFNYFGYSSSLSSKNLIVNEPNNDSLAYNAGIINVFKKVNQKWEIFQKLTTSQVNSNQQLGNHLKAIDSLIVASGNVNRNTSNSDALFIYRQHKTGSWPGKETEVFYLEKDLAENSYIRILEMDLNNEENLAVIYRKFDGFSSQLIIKILDLNSHSVLAEEILDKKDRFFYGIHTDVLLTDNSLFISNSDFLAPDRSFQGIVHVFEKDGEGIWNLEPVAKLTSSISFQYNFGIKMAYENDTLFVANSGDETSKNGLFIYNKPEMGWKDTTETLSIKKDFLYGNKGINLTVSQGVIFWSVPEVENDFTYYKPDSTSSDGYKMYIIEKPSDVGDSYLKFGFNPIYHENQLFISTRHSISNISNRINENILVYDFDLKSSEEMIEYSSILNSEFFSASDDEFGAILSVSKNTLAVSAKGSSNKWGDKSGSVYLYERLNDQWVFDQEIIAPQKLNNESFASTFELQDGYLFIGSPGYDSLADNNKYFNTGKIFIYEKINGKWVNTSSLVSPLMGSSNYEQGEFGRNVTFNNGILAISEIYDNYGSSEAEGRVYIYRYDEISGKFIVDKQFQNNETYGLDYFGSNIIINDKYVAIGTGGLPTSVYVDNKVYLYKINSEAWTSGKADYVFASKNESSLDKFGESISIHNDVLLVGETYYDNGKQYEGSDGRVYGFRIPEQSTLDETIFEDFYIEPNSSISYTNFGNYIAINGNDLYISAKDNSNESNVQDLLFVYNLENLNEVDSVFGNNIQIIRHPDGNSSSGFGSSVEVNNGYLIVGSPYSDSRSGFKSGLVHVFELSSILNPIPNLCNNISSYELIASPAGGVWSIGDSVISDNILDVTRLISGNYTINYNLNGCIQSTTFQVYQNTSLISKSDSIITKCIDEEINLFIEANNNDESFAWFSKKEKDDNYELLDSAKSLISISTANPGFYKVRLLNPECEEIEEEFQVLNHELSPKLNLSGQLEYCVQEIPIAIENIDPSDEVLWYFRAENEADFKELSTQDAQIQISESGEYYAEVYRENCSFLTNSTYVMFKPNPQDIFIPNVATVNNDGYNDVFRIKTDYPFKNFKINIYDRYGKQVFESYDQTFGWKAPNGYSGNYVYRLLYETECGEIKEMKGWVQIVKN
tara:strand:- start:28866 stop:32336 length:3471 start_codon:yes stop_codon:yes gene_type:complete